MVHNDMLRHLPDCALDALLVIFNHLWESGEFPASWREATVIPLLKPGKSGRRSLALSSYLTNVVPMQADGKSGECAALLVLGEQEHFSRGPVRF